MLTEAAKEVVRELRRAGIVFTITSGRPPRGMSMLIEPLALHCAIAGFDGGVFVNPDLSVIESHTLDPATAKQTLKLILDQGLDAWVYTEDEWLIRDQGGAVCSAGDEHGEIRRQGCGVLHGRALGARGEDRRNLRRFRPGRACEKVAQSALGEEASATRSQPYYLDVTHPKANKGTVVATLSKLLNIPTAQIATIGDMPNDVPMFRKSGFSIAMGNSSDEVKAQASAVTDSNENEGFAKAVRKFVLCHVCA